MNSIRKLHGNIVQQKHVFRKFIKHKNAKIILIGTPTHNNIGDSAISIAELLFFQKCGFKSGDILEITLNECIDSFEAVLFGIRTLPNALICFHGGGNMGDVWEKDEIIRQRIIRLVRNRLVVFPQTIFYSHSVSGDEKKRNSRVIYNGKSNVTLFARDRKSFQLMQSLYPNTRVVLCPDLVLSTNMKDFGLTHSKRAGALICKRNDIEKIVEDNTWNSVENYLSQRFNNIYITDMCSESSISAEKRYDIIREKMREYINAEIVITDRLHGMIFAAITETPCVVFGNNNHKIKEAYNLISYLPYIKYVNCLEESIAAIDYLYGYKDCYYSTEPIDHYFRDLKSIFF